MRRSRVGSLDVIFIEEGQAPTGEQSFLISLVAAVGWAHEACIDPNGVVHSIRPGAAHLAEHVLNAAYHDQLWPGWASHVEADSTVWSVPFTVTADVAPESVAAAAAALLTVATGRERWKTHLHQEAAAICSERGGSHPNPRYLLNVALHDALFPQHGLGRDPFGDGDTILAMTIDDLIPVAGAVRGALRTLFVLGPINDEIGRAVFRSVVPFAMRFAREEVWRPLSRSAFDRRPRGLRLIESDVAPDGQGLVAVGVRQPGLRAIRNRATRARRLVLCDALATQHWRPLPWHGYEMAQVFARLFPVPAWLDADDARVAMSEHRSRLRRALQRDANVADAVELHFRISSQGLEGWLRWARLAERHDLDLEAVASAAADVAAADAECLATELEAAEGSLVYVGPSLG